MARITVQITTPSNNRITVSPGVSALSSVQLYLNELVDVDTSGGQDGYVLTQQADGSFAMNAIVTRLDGLSDTNIVSPGAGDALVYDDQSSKWVPGGVKSVNGQEGDVVITIPSPPPTPGVSGLADTNITNLQDDQIIRYDSNSGNWLNEDLEALPAGGTAGQALVKVDGTDYNVTWDDIAVDVQYHQRYATTAETLRSGATETVELYFFAQGDGNGLAESAQSDTATTGNDIRRKLYYAEKAQADPDTSGDWTQFTAIADNTTFANAKAALLAYLKERTGGTVPISLKQTWEEVAQAPAFTGLLNESYGSGASAAYSVRRLNGNYTGSAIQVERSSDNSYQDIGFDSNGDLDESALTTFCTGTTCKVRTWYDQSQTGGTGSGNDAVQTTHTKQPTIYTGGAIVKENGRVKAEFDGVDDFMQSTITDTSQAYDIYSIFKYNTTPTDIERIYDSGTGGRITRASSLSTNEFIFSGTTLNWSYRQAIQVQETHVYNGSNSVARVSGTETASGNAGSSSTGTNFVIGARDTTADHYLDGSIQELILFDNSKTTGNRTSVEENQGDYFTQNTPLLDTYTGATVAYSLRKLRTAYTGNAVTVRRASDNFTQGIGFNVFGELDTVSLAAFCGASDGFVDTWHDQSGNGNDATQSTTADQPKIYDSVTGVVTRNAKPAIYIDRDSNSSGDKLVTPATTWMDSNLEYACVTVFTPGSGNVGDTWVWDSSGGGTNRAPGIKSVAAVGIQMQALGTTNAIVAVSAAGRAIRSAYLSSGTLEAFYNGSSAGTATAAGTYNASIEKYMGSRIGANEGHFDGYFQEMIWYANDQSSNRTNIESNINTFYSIY